MIEKRKSREGSKRKSGDMPCVSSKRNEVPARAEAVASCHTHHIRHKAVVFFSFSFIFFGGVEEEV